VSARGRGLGNAAGERGNERRSTLIGSVIETGGEINSPFKDRRCGSGWGACWIVSEGEEAPVELKETRGGEVVVDVTLRGALHSLPASGGARGRPIGSGGGGGTLAGSTSICMSSRGEGDGARGAGAVIVRPLQYKQGLVAVFGSMAAKSRTRRRSEKRRLRWSRDLLILLFYFYGFAKS
jgi:hypothetical protein